MKTYVKTRRIPPAVAFITPENLTLNYYHKGVEFSQDSTALPALADQGIEGKIKALLYRVDCEACDLVIILSGQLTLFTELVFPGNLSDTQVGELVWLQLLKRTQSAEINTYYDYFLLRKTPDSSIYALIEARKDFLQSWMRIFRASGFRPVAAISQPIVLFNYITQNIDLDTRQFEIACLLPTRIYLGQIVNNKLQKMTEHVISADSCNPASLSNFIIDDLAMQADMPNYPIVILDTFNCGVTDNIAGNVRHFPGFVRENVLGENTIKWLRSENDMYQSVALA